MRTVYVGIAVFVLLLGTGPSASARKKSKHAFNAAYGPARAGLRLAVQVDRTGTQVRFRLKNDGKRAATVNIRFSCSGYSHWGLRGGRKKSALNRTYLWSPGKAGFELSTRTRGLVCTVNGPIHSIQLAPGKVTTVKLPVAKGVRLKANRYLQGHVSLFLTVHRHVMLRTTVARRLTP